MPSCESGEWIRQNTTETPLWARNWNFKFSKYLGRSISYFLICIQQKKSVVAIVNSSHLTNYSEVFPVFSVAIYWQCLKTVYRTLGEEVSLADYVRLQTVNIDNFKCLFGSFWIKNAKSHHG